MTELQTPSTVGATYVEPSAEEVLEPGRKIGDLLRRNMTQPYVLQRLSERAWWVQASNYGTVFYVGDDGVLVLDALEGVYDNITQAVASVTDKPITAAVYPHYHADHIGDIDKYVEAANAQGAPLRIIGSEKTLQSMDLANSSFPRPTDVLDGRTTSSSSKAPRSSCTGSSGPHTPMITRRGSSPTIASSTPRT